MLFYNSYGVDGVSVNVGGVGANVDGVSVNVGGVGANVDGVSVNVGGVGANVDGGADPSWGDVNGDVVDCGGICCCWESGCCRSCCCRKAHWGDCAPM